MSDLLHVSLFYIGRHNKIKNWILTSIECQTLGIQIQNTENTSEKLSISVVPSFFRKPEYLKALREESSTRDPKRCSHYLLKAIAVVRERRRGLNIVQEWNASRGPSAVRRTTKNTLYTEAALQLNTMVFSAQNESGKISTGKKKIEKRKLLRSKQKERSENRTTPKKIEAKDKARSRSDRNKSGTKKKHASESRKKTNKSDR